ncbi:MAG: hypothetical protein D6798_05950 [Deltaproteobacteria bacterium]|nr:MAG: hypothetical protein D6798_05950 [Deltaproteobacteria bacterium]
MINCSDMAQRLFDYAMDDLAPDARAEVDAHLAACRPCARLVGEYQAVRHMVHEALEVELSEAELAALDAEVIEAVQRAG